MTANNAARCLFPDIDEPGYWASLTADEPAAATPPRLHDVGDHATQADLRGAVRAHRAALPSRMAWPHFHALRRLPVGDTRKRRLARALLELANAAAASGGTIARDEARHALKAAGRAPRTVRQDLALLIESGTVQDLGDVYGLPDYVECFGDPTQRANMVHLAARRDRLRSASSSRAHRARHPSRRPRGRPAKRHEHAASNGENINDSKHIKMRDRGNSLGVPFSTHLQRASAPLPEMPLPAPEKFEDAFGFDALCPDSGQQQAVDGSALAAPTQDAAESPAAPLAPTSALELVQGLVPTGVPEGPKQAPEARQADADQVLPPTPAVAAPGGQDAAEPAWLTAKRRALAARMAANDNTERERELAAEAARMAELTRVRPRPCPAPSRRMASAPRCPDGVRAEQGGGPAWRAKALDVDPKPAVAADWERMCGVHGWLGRSWWAMLASLRPSRGHLLRAVGILADARAERALENEPGFLKRVLQNVQAGR